MIKKAGPFLPSAQSALEYAQQMMECTAQLLQSQLDITEKVYTSTTSGYREIIKSGEPSAIMNKLPKIVENTIRVTSEGATGYLTNGLNYQNTVIDLMKNKVPEMNRQFIKSMMESTQISSAS